MVDRVSFNIRNICLRILVVLILGIIIWQFISYLSDILTDEEYSLLNHFLTAVATATLTFILIQATLKIDKVSWKQLGQGTFVYGNLKMNHHRT